MMPLSAKLEDAVTGQWLRIGTKEIFTGNSSMCNDVPSCAERRLPFADVITLNFHFDKHKNEFSFASEIEYQIAADAFMSGIANPPVKECTRITGDRVRFDRKSGCFAVVAPSGFLKTFHKPSQKWKDKVYFEWECARVT